MRNDIQKMNKDNISAPGGFHKAAHKLFLFFMFVVCSIAVVLFAQSQVRASLSENINTDISSNAAINIAPVNDSISINSSTIKQPAQISTETDSVKAATTLTGMILSGNAVTSEVEKEAEVSKTVEQKTADVRVKEVTVKNEIQETKPSASSPVTATKTMEISVEPVNKLPERNIEQIRPQNEDSLPMPIIVKVTGLPAEKNPKISGEINPSLSITSVELVSENEEKSVLSLKGRAQADALVTVYIFSKDPYIIALKADKNGEWSYDLNRDLADGQHEAYVAISDSSGKVISKGEPFAFVKTAQAATRIPVSELKENQSPMERSTSNYIVIAIAIMSVCLIIALALIGILTHKDNLNEPTI